MFSTVFCLLLLFVAKIFSSKFSYSEIIPANYDRDLAPTLNGKPLIANVSFVVLSFIPDMNQQMSFNMDFFYHICWTDYRLKAPEDKKLILNSQWKDKLWLPDSYFRNSISGGIPSLLHQNLYFSISEGKNVFMASRIQMKLQCDMDFSKFPFDTQTCFINITTLSQTADVVRLSWSKEGFRIHNRILLPEYQLSIGERDDHCIKSFKNIGDYSCLYVSFILKRNVGKYIIKRYIPSTLIVFMTFIGFWLPTQSTPARVALIITALLALIAQQIQGELNISYVYALEVYTIICILFVFSTLIEYSIAVSYPNNYLTQNSIDNNNKKSKGWLRFLTLANEQNCIIDVISRSIFPIAFLMVIFVYSLVYCFYY